MLCLTKKDETGYSGGPVVDGSKSSMTLKKVSYRLDNPHYLEIMVSNFDKPEYIHADYFKVSRNTVEHAEFKNDKIVLKLQEPLVPKKRYSVEYDHMMNAKGKQKRRFKFK
ncbi:hypothetical protein RCC89_02465 [Cytophagaceae bacterium ABcell3]|nr:hypothetical protein RCC89_02465 [Cytophagaceae bacterium ABcell3]